MLLSFNDEDANNYESEDEYYDSLEADSWGTAVVGTWEDLE